MQCTVVLTTVGGPWLGEQLAALAVQTRAPAQLVLVNNGPAGAVDDLVARWQPELPGLELVEDAAMAVCGFARNIGAARARHPGLLFIDDDDVVDPGYVEAMSRGLDDYEMTAARIDVEQLNRPGLSQRWGTMQSDAPMDYHDFLPWVIGGALGVRTETFHQVGGFDTDYLVAEDTDFCWRVQLQCSAKIGFVPEARMAYRLRGDARPAFRQARKWALWDVALYKHYRSAGRPAPGNQVRALMRWGRPLLVAVTARSREDLVVAARLLGGCLGRAQGSVRHRCLFL